MFPDFKVLFRRRSVVFHVKFDASVAFVIGDGKKDSNPSGLDSSDETSSKSFFSGTVPQVYRYS